MNEEVPEQKKPTAQAAGISNADTFASSEDMAQMLTLLNQVKEKVDVLVNGQEELINGHEELGNKLEAIKNWLLTNRSCGCSDATGSSSPTTMNEEVHDQDQPTVRAAGISNPDELVQFYVELHERGISAPALHIHMNSGATVINCEKSNVANFNYYQDAAAADFPQRLALLSQVFQRMDEIGLGQEERTAFDEKPQCVVIHQRAQELACLSCDQSFQESRPRKNFSPLHFDCGLVQCFAAALSFLFLSFVG